MGKSTEIPTVTLVNTDYSTVRLSDDAVEVLARLRAGLGKKKALKVELELCDAISQLAGLYWRAGKELKEI